MDRLSVVPLSALSISEIAAQYKREQIQYGYYQILNDQDLICYQEDKLQKLASSKEAISLACVCNSHVVGLIAFAKDTFDSQYFNMDCYRIAELSVFAELRSDIVQVSRKLLEEVETKIRKSSGKCYMSAIVDNNLEHQSAIFNSLASNGYLYIHTLLTFSIDNKNAPLFMDGPQNSDLIIRESVAADIDQIADLASRSFVYSRFHMDFLLDDHKADMLLKDSAVNSIRHGFADIMFVAEHKGKIVGYYSGKKKRLEQLKIVMGEAIISAVDQNYRGMGVFSALDDALLGWFLGNVDYAEMGTYLANYPVHRTWIKKGLKLIKSTHQLSKVF